MLVTATPAPAWWLNAATSRQEVASWSAQIIWARAAAICYLSGRLHSYFICSPSKQTGLMVVSRRLGALLLGLARRAGAGARRMKRDQQDQADALMSERAGLQSIVAGDGLGKVTRKDSSTSKSATAKTPRQQYRAAWCDLCYVILYHLIFNNTRSCWPYMGMRLDKNKLAGRTDERL